MDTYSISLDELKKYLSAVTSGNTVPQDTELKLLNADLDQIKQHLDSIIAEEDRDTSSYFEVLVNTYLQLNKKWREDFLENTRMPENLDTSPPMALGIPPIIKSFGVGAAKYTDSIRALVTNDDALAVVTALELLAQFEYAEIEPLENDLVELVRKRGKIDTDFLPAIITKILMASKSPKDKIQTWIGDGSENLRDILRLYIHEDEKVAEAIRSHCENPSEHLFEMLSAHYLRKKVESDHFSDEDVFLCFQFKLVSSPDELISAVNSKLKKQQLFQELPQKLSLPCRILFEIDLVQTNEQQLAELLTTIKPFSDSQILVVPWSYELFPERAILSRTISPKELLRFAQYDTNSIGYRLEFRECRALSSQERAEASKLLQLVAKTPSWQVVPLRTADELDSFELSRKTAKLLKDPNLPNSNNDALYKLRILFELLVMVIYRDQFPTNDRSKETNQFERNLILKFGLFLLTIEEIDPYTLSNSLRLFDIFKIEKIEDHLNIDEYHSDYHQFEEAGRKAAKCLLEVYKTSSLHIK